MQQANRQLKDQLSQALATGSLQVRKAERPAPVNAVQKQDPLKALRQALSICSRIEATHGVIEVDPTIRRLESVRQLVHPFGVPIKDDRTAKATELRRSAETCQNYIATVATGIRNNDLDTGDLPGVVTKLTRLVREVIARVEAYNAKEAGAVHDELTEAKMERFAVSKQRLVSRILKSDRITAFAVMPILAIFDPAVRTADLLDAGLPVEGYDGLYSIVTEQHVIGIANDSEQPVSDLLQRAIASVSKAKRTRYSLVSNQSVGMAKYGMKFFWIADQETLAILDNVKGNHIQVAQWSFPF